MDTNVIDYEKNDKYDEIKLLHNETAKPLKFKNGTISLYDGCSNPDNNYNTKEGNLILIVSSKKAAGVYEYLSENTQVEWGHTESSSGKHFLTTGHKHRTESGIVEISQKIIAAGETIPQNSHSHPENTALPSKKDIGMINSINEANKKNNPNAPELKSTIYIPREQRYIDFNKDSECADD